MLSQPIAEVFGFPPDNVGVEACRYRKSKLCPFGNKVPNCTKDKSKNPLGVCSILDGEEIVITCPIRFRQHWIIAEDAARFFFPPDSQWTTLTEVRLSDKYGKSAGNIDIVLVSYDEKGCITDFGSLEIQAVYISGNIRNWFEQYMKNPDDYLVKDFQRKSLYPRPDYLSSSRKRLAPQLIFKGGIFHEWKKRMAVALNISFFETLPHLDEVEPEVADIAWLIYELKHDNNQNRYFLQRQKIVYTKFKASLEIITTSQAGNVKNFIDILQGKIDKKIENGNKPDVEVMESPF